MSFWHTLWVFDIGGGVENSPPSPLVWVGGAAENYLVSFLYRLSLNTDVFLDVAGGLVRSFGPSLVLRVFRSILYCCVVTQRIIPRIQTTVISDLCNIGWKQDERLGGNSDSIVRIREIWHWLIVSVRRVIKRQPVSRECALNCVGGNGRNSPRPHVELNINGPAESVN